MLDKPTGCLLEDHWQYTTIPPPAGRGMQPSAIFTSFAITEQMLALGRACNFTIDNHSLNADNSLGEIYNASSKYLYGWTALDQRYLHLKGVKCPQRTTELRLHARVIQTELFIAPSTTTHPVLTLGWMDATTS
ncbi:uncharacterized protein F5147DRAFT_649102 [Suillus discolor]|uniref:Uncharacterized protein n=1 Tax=Suillus discolor TaxID=1912936 RepID=A0A9P7JYA7_9AGAM|nr:uncharacterized protein F5147DRAFT_649102 [Suillus discolor]KAG2116644.1 hypothetical protein F5147DRAFT_649102 [Suillus discolor]